MRQKGHSFSKIADALELPKSTVKTFCWRNQKTACDDPGEIQDNDSVIHIENKDHCANCGTLLEQRPKQKPRRFCDDSCRYAYWREHRDCLSTFYPVVCAHCGKEFNGYGNKGRKYCCHPCYIAARYGTGDSEVVVV